MHATSPVNAALLHAGADAFTNDFDRRSFDLQHELADNPLFEPERLIALAQHMARDPRDVYFDAGDVRIGQRWDAVPTVDASVHELLHRIETANAWIVLFNVQKDPAYAVLLDACIAEIEARSGIDLRAVTKLQQAIVFVNSPHRITPFHIDRECSVLLQMRGTKTIHIFDRDDRDVVTETELEQFWSVDNNAPVYRPELEHRASVFTLTPGSGVHIPVNAPHWIQNGPDVSVSLNINFHYKDKLLGDVYRTNRLLRRLGVQPVPPRRSAFADRIKGTLYDSVRELRRTAKSLRARH